MPRPLAVIESGRVDLSMMVTRRFKLDDIERHTICFQTRDGVLEVAITP